MAEMIGVGLSIRQISRIVGMTIEKVGSQELFRGLRTRNRPLALLREAP